MNDWQSKTLKCTEVVELPLEPEANVFVIGAKLFDLFLQFFFKASNMNPPPIMIEAITILIESLLAARFKLLTASSRCSTSKRTVS